MDWKKKKVLVTGASGFVGSYLTRQLVRQGADVYAWTASTQRLWRLSDVAEQVCLSQVDIRNFQQVQEACRKIQPEFIYHLAAYGVNYDEQDVVQAVAVNVQGTTHLLEALSEMGCRKIVGTGTWAEYGAKDHPIRENEPLEPIGLYGCTKAAATTIALGIASFRRLPLIILRPFSIYGPGEGNYKFIPTVIRSCLKKQSPRLTSCRQVRDYLFIEDLIDAYLKAAEADAGSFPVVNVASGRPVALTEIVSSILKHFPDVQPAFGALPDREQEIWSVQADVSRSRDALGWHPAHSLERGIEHTVAWYREHPHG